MSEPETIDQKEAKKALVLLLNTGSLEEGFKFGLQVKDLRGAQRVLEHAPKKDPTRRASLHDRRYRTYYRHAKKAHDGDLDPDEVFGFLLRLLDEPPPHINRKTVFSALAAWTLAVVERQTALMDAVLAYLKTRSIQDLLRPDSPLEEDQGAGLLQSWTRSDMDFADNLVRGAIEGTGRGDGLGNERAVELVEMAERSGRWWSTNQLERAILTKAANWDLDEGDTAYLRNRAYSSDMAMRSIRDGLLKVADGVSLGREEAALLLDLCSHDDDLETALEAMLSTVDESSKWPWFEEQAIEALVARYMRSPQLVSAKLAEHGWKQDEARRDAAQKLSLWFSCSLDLPARQKRAAGEILKALYGLQEQQRGATPSLDLAAVMGALGSVGDAYHVPEVPVRCIHAALQSAHGGRMAVLGGPPGTGKTLLALMYAGAVTGYLSAAVDSAGSNAKPKDMVSRLQALDGFRKVCQLVRVRPDWTSDREVLGYVNILAQPPIFMKGPVYDLLVHAHEHTSEPHFLILDEMNLSHPEHYLSQIISAMESGGEIRFDLEAATDRRLVPGRGATPEPIPYPSNLRIIGTVNQDETTRGLSPRLRSRAHLIEVRTEWDKVRADGDRATLAKLLAELDHVMLGAGLGMSLRDLDHIEGFLKEYAPDGPGDDGSWREGLDVALCQKLLPRLRGTKDQLGIALPALRDALRTQCGRLLPGAPRILKELEARMGRLDEIGFIDG